MMRAGVPLLQSFDIVARELAREDGDVLLLDGGAAAGPALLDLVDEDALTPQRGADHGFAAGPELTTDDLAVAVLAFPFEDEILDVLCCSGGGGHALSSKLSYSLVADRTSSSVVTPIRTFTRPD